MKNLKLALAALLLASFATGAFAQESITTLPRMKWNRGGVTATDSTRISIPGAAASVDFSDTTVWLDLAQYKFASRFSQEGIVAFQINKQLTATTDSIGFQVQFSNDINNSTTTYGAGTLAYITTVAATTYGITAGQDGLVGMVVASCPKATTGQASGTLADMPWRFVRLVVQNSDTSGATGRVYFSVTPVIFGWRP